MIILYLIVNPKSTPFIVRSLIYRRPQLASRFVNISSVKYTYLADSRNATSQRTVWYCHGFITIRIVNATQSGKGPYCTAWLINRSLPWYYPDEHNCRVLLPSNVSLIDMFFYETISTNHVLYCITCRYMANALCTQKRSAVCVHGSPSSFKLEWPTLSATRWNFVFQLICSKRIRLYNIFNTCNSRLDTYYLFITIFYFSIISN